MIIPNVILQIFKGKMGLSEKIKLGDAQALTRIGVGLLETDKRTSGAIINKGHVSPSMRGDSGEHRTNTEKGNAKAILKRVNVNAYPSLAVTR